MDILGISVLLRWLESKGQTVAIPDAGYKGDYIRDIAAHVDTSRLPEVRIEALLDGLPADAPEGDKEVHISALVESAEKHFGPVLFDEVRREALELIRADIEQDLAEFGVTYDCWFSETSLNADNRIDEDEC